MGSLLVVGEATGSIESNLQAAGRSATNTHPGYKPVSSDRQVHLRREIGMQETEEGSGTEWVAQGGALLKEFVHHTLVGAHLIDQHGKEKRACR
jgi:hypothetical protein